MPLDDYALDRIKQHQQKVIHGYIHGVEKEYKLSIASQLIIIITQYLNCILDINFDKNCPNKDNFNIFTDKKLQSIGDTGKYLICNVDKVFTKEMCDSFKIIFRATWTNPIESFGSFFQIGYVTQTLDKSIPDWQIRLGHQQHQYAFTIYQNEKCDPLAGSQDVMFVRSPHVFAHKTGDIFTMKYSFKSNKCEIYRNDKSYGIYFDHSSQSNKPKMIIPVVNVLSTQNKNWGTIAILGCILFV